MVEVYFPEIGDVVAEAGIDNALALVAHDGGIVQRNDNLLFGVVAEVAPVAFAEHGGEGFVQLGFILNQAGIAAGVFRGDKAEAGDELGRGGGEIEIDFVALAREHNVVPLGRKRIGAGGRFGGVGWFVHGVYPSWRGKWMQDVGRVIVANKHIKEAGVWHDYARDCD